jgi:UDP-glucuronate 4-epimerase
MTFPFTHVLLTGGAGFIGSHLAEALLAAGVKVSVLDDFNDFYDPAIKEGNIAGFRDKIVLEKGDLRDIPFVEGVFERGGFDCVIHLAARAGVRPSLADPRLYVSTNVDGTLNLLESCRIHGIKRFVFASSSSVYGVNEKVPFAETDLIQRTISPYAATKLMGEQLCSNYSNLYGIRCMCLRFFTVYGPRQRPDLAIAKFTRKIMNGQPIDQYGDGSTARDYTFIDDIISGVLAAACYDGSDFDIFNLGGSDTNTLRTLIELIENTLGKKAEIRRMPNQPGDVPRTSADVTKATKLLGYRPTTALEAGIRRYVDWVSETG